MPITNLSPIIPAAEIDPAMATDSEVNTAIANHIAAPDPHSQYLLTAEGDARYRQISVALADSDIPSSIARDTEVTGAINNHLAAPDPHSQYLLTAEGDARYRQISVALADNDIPSSIARDSEVTGAINNHLAAPDPHVQYLLQSEGDVRYRISTFKEKTITGTIHASGGGDTAIPHGITGNNIVGIECLVFDTVRSWKIPPGFVNTTHDYFCYTTATLFVIYIPGSGLNSGNVLGQPFEVVLTYR